jgi:hypothetical protein
MEHFKDFTDFNEEVIGVDFFGLSKMEENCKIVNFEAIF